jgi:general secretion pathway protein H
MTCRSDDTEAGFTLIELIVVFAIVAVLIVMVAGRGSPVSPATHARAAAREMAGAMRAARSEAIMTNRSVFFSVDANGRRYWWGKRMAQLLPSDLNVALLTAKDQMESESVGHVRFDPDGGSTGGRVAIAGGGHNWWVGVDWLSGRVTVVEKPLK